MIQPALLYAEDKYASAQTSANIWCCLPHRRGQLKPDVSRRFLDRCYKRPHEVHIDVNCNTFQRFMHVCCIPDAMLPKAHQNKPFAYQASQIWVA